ncbi:hypothetical protein CUMW_246810 [Citrus unshiu]|uniref:Uncharacterized protein n=1 Tax=Citrus unshiu TaxID=55188 RepID=A0A2H5QPK9_CITUN|nr:hypothetical protein CUMW_246810 [Citrus unshiu]
MAAALCGAITSGSRRTPRSFGEHFWQTLLFKCLELTMLEYCEPFMHLLRFVLLAHIGCHQMMSEESGNLRSYFECSHFSSGTIGALQVAFECDECFQCDNVSLM